MVGLSNVNDKIIVVRATKNDSKDIWSWRNDELTLLMFKKGNIVSWQEHSQWFENSLNNSSRCLYLGYLGENEKIGMCRFDINAEKNNAEVSINLNPMFRNRNLSYRLLNSGIEEFLKVKNTALIAWIKKSNTASIKCFMKCGFVFDRFESDFALYIRNVV